MAKTKTKQPNIIDRTMARLDTFQRNHKAFGYPYAVIKKYGDDDAGHQAALVTYYGFLALFPLLLAAISVIDLITRANSEYRAQLFDQIQAYIPVASDALQKSIHASDKTGIALVLSLLVIIYGARGIADVMRGALDHAWSVPKVKRSRFPLNILKSIALLVGTGLGLLITTTIAGYATAALTSPWLGAVPLLINLLLLYLIFMYVFLIGSSRKHKRSDIRLGALVAATGIVILQYVGTYLVKHQLQNLQGLYGQFALVLSILFWIYLQAQVVMYAIEINVVHTFKLWPRSLTGKQLTPADQKAYRLLAEKEAMRVRPEEEIDVSFTPSH